MSNALNSDEDKYADESFENDTDEIPEISETDTENESETQVSPNRALLAYARNRVSGRKPSLHNKNYVPYDSSSEDDNDVVISETVAEISTEPMCMDDALKVRKLPPKPVAIRRANSARLTGKLRMSIDSPKILKEPQLWPTQNVENSPTYVSDDANFGEVSDNEANEIMEPEVENELVQKLSRLNCDHNEIPNKPNMESADKSLSSNLVQTEVSNEEPPKEILEIESNDETTELVVKCQENFDSWGTDNENNYEIEENDSEIITNPSQYEPNIEMHISTETPTSLNSEEYAFHLNFLKTNASNEKLNICRMRPHPRKSWSFSNDRMREIDRHNHILLRKILSQKPTYHLATPKPTKYTPFRQTARTTSAAINRKKKQRQIDLDNQGLKRRIEAISLRRPVQQHLN